MKNYGYKKLRSKNIRKPLIKDANLLATSEIWNESKACSELWMLLRACGDETPIVNRTRIRGLIAAKTVLTPLDAIKLLRIELRERPEGFRSLLRIIPIEIMVPTKLDIIVEKIKGLASKITHEKSFRITLEKRRTSLRSREVIDAVAGIIEQRVDLVKPDWIVLVEIVGELTGLSVVPSDGILNVQKERIMLATQG